MVASPKILQHLCFSAFLGRQASIAILASQKSVNLRFSQPPALRVEVTALAQRKRQGFLLFFLFSTYFAVFERESLLDHCFHTPSQMAHSGVLPCGGASGCPVWLECHTRAHKGLHGGPGGEVGFGNVQFQFSELLLVEIVHCQTDGADRVEIVAFPLHSALIEVAAGFCGDESCFQ